MWLPGGEKTLLQGRTRRHLEPDRRVLRPMHFGIIISGTRHNHPVSV